MYSQRTKNNLQIGIMGAGAFGTSLAVLYSQFHKVTLFSSFIEHVNSMNRDRENEFLKGYKLPENIEIKVITQLKEHNFDYIFWCFPITPSLEILKNIVDNIQRSVPIIICAKGVTSTGTFLLDEFSKFLPNNPVGIMSGPNFAVDIANLSFSAADIGFKDIKIANSTSKILTNQYMKMFPTDDVIGLQIAGAIKNIIAIACGILVGLDAGQNAVSAMLTYGLAEMMAIGEALGARRETFYGLSGVGDLMLTSSSETSRNMAFGKRLGMGESIDEIAKSQAPLSEGKICVEYIQQIAQKIGVETPICDAVFNIISNKIQARFILNIFIDKI